MYQSYFGFKDAPFSIAPDPRYLYMTAQHREALAHLVYGLNSEGGCILLSGEVGTGKTTICRCLLDQIPERINVALILNPKLTEIELLETICDELKISYPKKNKTLKIFTDRIYDYLIKKHHNDEKTILIIDEAQNLSIEVLEQLRLLTNLETDQQKLLQIIILGQPELLDILATNEMRQLSQRITARFHLKPLTKYDVKSYISHRLAIAGQNLQLFPDESIKLLFKLSKGVPRLINVLCDRALLGAFVENQFIASPAIIKKAAKEVFGEFEYSQKKRNTWVITSLSGIILILFCALIYFAYSYYFTNAAQVSKRATSSTAQLNPAEPTAEKLSVNESSIDQSNINEPNMAHSTETITTEIGTNTATSVSPKAIAIDDLPLEDIELTSPEITTSITTNAETSEPLNNKGSTKGIESAKSNTTSPTKSITSLNGILASNKTDQKIAITALFSRWQKTYNPKSNKLTCTQSQAFSLYCLEKVGNINTLTHLNRPAILTLVDQDNNTRFITLIALAPPLATIEINKEHYQVSLKDINQYWYGKFILLWKKPKNYRVAVRPQSKSKLIPWLQKQLITLGVSFKPTNSLLYNEKLVTLVKDFQKQAHLDTDGIIGPATIIQLNTLTQASIPKLQP